MYTVLVILLFVVHNLPLPHSLSVVMYNAKCLPEVHDVYMYALVDCLSAILFVKHNYSNYY